MGFEPLLETVTTKQVRTTGELRATAHNMSLANLADKLFYSIIIFDELLGTNLCAGTILGKTHAQQQDEGSKSKA